MITISAFGWVPPFAQGLVRDLRIRWALEEAGLPYRVRFIDSAAQASSEYRAEQPFGQVPTYEEDGLRLFESGAMVLHVAERSEALMPPDPSGRAKAKQWMFAAVSSIEPMVQQLVAIDLFFAKEPWAPLRRPSAEAMVLKRLGELSVALGDRDWLEDRFTVGDLMLTTVLRNLRHTDIVSRFPNLAAHLARCEARPAFQRALEGQMAPFRAHEQQQAQQQ